MITKKQKEVLDFIKKYKGKKKYAPSLEEIRKHFRLASVSTAHHYIHALDDAGYLSKGENQPRSIELFEKELMVQIPLAGTIVAGQPIEAIEEKETIAVPKSTLPRVGNVFALRVSGNSMIEENINDGDIVLLKQQSIAENGQKIVALIDNCEATLKKYYREKNHIRLQPANKNLKPIIIGNDHDFAIQGTVIDVIKNAFPETKQIPIKKERTHRQRNIENFENKVFEGDCLKIMKSIPEKSIDMILCDLPYGTTQNNWDSPIPIEKLWEQYERIIKDNGAIVLTAQGMFSAKLMLSNPKLFKYKIVWEKSKPTNFLNAKKQPLRKHEDILVFYKQQPEYHPQMTKGEPYNKGFRKNQLTGSYGDFKAVEVKSNGERYPTDVVYFKTAESEGTVYHPTQKPVDLGRYLIKTFTKEEHIILDNTCGSGSFLVSAILENRKFIGIEKNEAVYLHKKNKVDYIDICRKRITEAKEKYRLESNKLF
jgi:SOS regulatory protein LexA